jgi:Na+/melibiose symporter-like transporter
MEVKDDVGKKQVFLIGMGQFANNMSSVMLDSYLVIFYADVYGLSPTAVAMLLLKTNGGF